LAVAELPQREREPLEVPAATLVAQLEEEGRGPSREVPRVLPVAEPEEPVRLAEPVEPVRLAERVELAEPPTG